MPGHATLKLQQKLVGWPVHIQAPAVPSAWLEPHRGRQLHSEEAPSAQLGFRSLRHARLMEGALHGEAGLVGPAGLCQITGASGPSRDAPCP